MFGIKNLLKISMVFIFIFSACRPIPDVKISDETKEYIGYYSYDINDKLTVCINDTLNYNLVLSARQEEWSTIEEMVLCFSDSIINKAVIRIWVSPFDISFIIDRYKCDFRMDSVTFFPEIELRGKKYNDVYMVMNKEFTKNYFYASKDYGFIQIKYDSLNIQFIRN